jgi:predicted Zn-dependent protease with MMP-like domain
VSYVPGPSHSSSTEVNSSRCCGLNAVFVMPRGPRCDGLPEELGRLMRNVAVTVEHGQGPPGLLGLYQGIPLTDRTSQYAGVLPDRITIYRQAICAICNTEEEVADQVRRTVIHEVAHHFGIDDNRLSELGW